MPDASGSDQIRDTVTNASPVKSEPPRSLMRELPPATPFPVEALGILEPAVRAINDRIRAPMAICGQSVLGVANLAVQGHADVELPFAGGPAKPTSCWFVTVAASGERKTGSDNEATAPVRRREEALRAECDARLPDYINDKMAWEKAREAAIRRAKGDRDAIKKALDDIGPEPKAPLTPLLTCSEPTFEGLCKLFASGNRALGCSPARAANSSAATVCRLTTS